MCLARSVSLKVACQFCETESFVIKTYKITYCCLVMLNIRRTTEYMLTGLKHSQPGQHVQDILEKEGAGLATRFPPSEI